MPKNTNTKSKKRVNGKGTFFQLPDKTWVHQITLGRKDDGPLDRKCFTGKTRTVCIERREGYTEKMQRAEIEAQEEQARKAREIEEMLKRGHAIESETLFSEAFPYWLKLFKAPADKKGHYLFWLSEYLRCTF